MTCLSINGLGKQYTGSRGLAYLKRHLCSVSAGCSRSPRGFTWSALGAEKSIDDKVLSRVLATFCSCAMCTHVRQIMH